MDRNKIIDIILTILLVLFFPMVALAILISTVIVSVILCFVIGDNILNENIVEIYKNSKEFIILTIITWLFLIFKFCQLFNIF